MLICDDCKSENRDTAKFCRGCGVALVSAENREPKTVSAGARTGGADEVGASAAEPGVVNLTVAHMGGQGGVSRMQEEAVPKETVTPIQASCEANLETPLREENVTPPQTPCEATSTPPQESLEATSSPPQTPCEATSTPPQESLEATSSPPKESCEATRKVPSREEERGEESTVDAPRRRHSSRRPDEAPKSARPTCPSCGSHVRSLDKYCIWCGQQQPERMVQESKRCPDCGTVLPVAANFCFACGDDVEEYRSKKIRFPSELFEEVDPELIPKFEA